MTAFRTSPEQRRALATAAAGPRSAAEAEVLARLDAEAGMPGSAAAWRAVADAAREDAQRTGRVRTPPAGRSEGHAAIWRPRQVPSAWRPSAPWASGGFVTSLVALLISTVPIIGVVSMLVAPVALTVCLSAVARSDEGDAHRGRALAGAVIAALALLVAVTWPLALARSG